MNETRILPEIQIVRIIELVKGRSEDRVEDGLEKEIRLHGVW